MTKEIWKEIEGYEGLYKVSNLGNVQNRKGKKIKSFLGKAWKYKYVVLCKDKNQKSMTIHRLIAAAFISNPGSKPCVNHIDGDKHNNDVSNLEWCTHSENTSHAYKIGLCKPGKTCFKKGEMHKLVKLSKFQIQRIRLMKKIIPKITYAKIAKMFKISRSHAFFIVKRMTWKHI